MNKKDAIAFYKDLINDLIEEADFLNFLSYNERRSFLDWKNDSWYAFIGRHPEYEEVFVASGVTKGVFICEDTDYVLKVPFRNFRHNYCELEYRFYQLAIEKGIGECFAECDNAFTLEGIPFYLMEYADVNEDYTCDVVNTEYPEIAEEYDGDEGSSDYVGELCAKEWGIFAYDRYTEFAEENQINDVHAENVGWTERGLVVVDYSGFHG